MPMNFPDDALDRCALVHGFRPIRDDESIAEYRLALASHVFPIDRVEANEIRFGVGWDKWTEEQQLEMLTWEPAGERA